jgi:hypothetical protein
LTSPLRICVLLIVAAAAIAGCGGDDFSGSPGNNKAAQECRSPEAELPKAAAAVKAMAPGRRFDVDLSSATATAGKLGLQVRAITAVGSVKGQYDNQATFRPPAGYRFVALTYRIVNKGSKEIEAANSVNNVFLLQGRRRAAWVRVDKGENCATLSPSFAAIRGLTSPEEEIKPGRGYVTAVLYAVPRDETRLAWSGPGRRVRITERAP